MRTKPLEDLSEAQKDSIALLKEKLDLNQRQVRSALGSSAKRMSRLNGSRRSFLKLLRNTRICKRQPRRNPVTTQKPPL
jgi:hypothetical protein